MKLVTIHNDGGTEERRYLLPDSRLSLLIDYLKAVKQDDFSGTWGVDEQVLFARFSDQIPKDGT